jgi:two-component system OmpR family sensor kinase
MKRRWWLVPVPGLLGLVAAFLLKEFAASGPSVYARADIPALLSLVGLLASGALALALGVRARLHVERLRGAALAEAEASEERRRFLRQLDHELKNPLTGIRLGLANLAESGSEVDRRLILTGLEAEVLRLIRLAGNLRKLAELETRPLERAPVDVAEILQEVVALVQDREEAGERQLAISLPRAPWPLPGVPGDRDLLYLVFHNLVENAVKFTHPGDTIEIRGFEDGNSVAVEVADTGSGIPEAEQPLVWEELYRGEAARGKEGSGLGLPLARAIVRRHDGQISLRSRPGKGTVVTVRLPSG